MGLFSSTTYLGTDEWTENWPQAAYSRCNINDICRAVWLEPGKYRVKQDKFLVNELFGSHISYGEERYEKIEDEKPTSCVTHSVIIGKENENGEA